MWMPILVEIQSSFKHGFGSYYKNPWVVISSILTGLWFALVFLCFNFFLVEKECREPLLFSFGFLHFCFTQSDLLCPQIVEFPQTFGYISQLVILWDYGTICFFDKLIILVFWWYFQKIIEKCIAIPNFVHWTKKASGHAILCFFMLEMTYIFGIYVLIVY